MAAPRRARPLLIRLIAVAILVILVAVAVMGVRTVKHAVALKQRLDRVQALVGDNRSGGLGTEMFKSLRQELAGGREDFLALKRDLAPLLPVIERLGWLPKVGPSLAAAPHLLDMGEHFLGAASVLFAGLDPLVEAMLGGAGQGSLSERLVSPLVAAQPAFVEAQELIERAALDRQQIPATGLLPFLDKQLTRLDKYLPALRSASQMATISPVLLGAARPMNYLLIAQNNDELRPSGGFLTAIGTVTLDKGKINNLLIQNSYSVDNWQRDHPEPPEPFTRYMEAFLWVFRDANFWPDFPTTARVAQYFSELDMDYTPDGVIAVDQFALQMLVGGIGSVVVPEFNNDVLTGENTIAKIRGYWEPAPDREDPRWATWYSEHKQFISYLVQAIRSKLEGDTRSLNPVQFGKALLAALNEKHIQIYLNDPFGGGLSAAANWAGTISPAGSDYLFVVDTNMGFNKANGIVQRAIDYTITIDPAGLARSQVTISYTNPSTRQIECIHDSYWEGSYELMMNRCYYNYLRVYLPIGTTLIAAEDGGSLEEAGLESAKQVWADWLVVAPRQQAQVALRYYLPWSVLRRAGDNWEYQLTVQKQAGTDRTPLSVTVTLPVGSRIVAATPAPTAIAGNVVAFKSDLATDQEFRVVLE